VVIKTNLLYDAGISSEPSYRTPMPNLEVEYLISRRWSVSLAGLYEGWAHNIHNYARWHVTSYTLEGRYRILPDKCWGGLYIGAYGRVGDYNLLYSWDDLTSGNHTGRYNEVGLSAGYTWPFAKHWVVEAGVQGGYRHSNVKNYTHEEPDNNYYDNSTLKNALKLTGLYLNIGYRFGW
jgi:hypothetical protein